VPTPLGIALSILTLGLVITLALWLAAPVALVLIAVYAAFHGFAHGAELPATAHPAYFVLGFVVATGLIHLVGISIGVTAGKTEEGRLTRSLGGAIAAVGVYFLIE
jgi:urease accessory protein